MVRLSEITEKAKNRAVHSKHPSTMVGLDSILPKFQNNFQDDDVKDYAVSRKDDDKTQANIKDSKTLEGQHVHLNDHFHHLEHLKINKAFHETKSTTQKETILLSEVHQEVKPASTSLALNKTFSPLEKEPLQEVKPTSTSEALQQPKPASLTEPLQQVKASIFNLVGLSLNYEMAASVTENEKLFLAIVMMGLNKSSSKSVRISREAFMELGINRARITRTRDSLVEKGLINTQLVVEKNREYVEYELNF